MKGTDGFPVRIGFVKRGPVRFISHRDLARAFERAFRVAELPLAFTLGFVPRHKVGFGLALSVGHESDAEYLDFELTHDPGVAGIGPLVNQGLPEGMAVTAAVALARAGIPLNLLQRQLGHKHITMTMRYAEFHPDYSDAAIYFDRVGARFGLLNPGNSLGNTPVAPLVAEPTP